MNHCNVSLCRHCESAEHRANLKHSHNNTIIKDHYVRVIAFIDNPPFQHEPLAKRHRPDMEKILRTSLYLEIAEVPRRGTEMI